jgi:hypothetical protein
MHSIKIICYLNDGTGKASGLIGVWASNAVTFLIITILTCSLWTKSLIFLEIMLQKGMLISLILEHLWFGGSTILIGELSRKLDAMIKIRKDNLLSSTLFLNIVAASNKLLRM